MIKPNISIDTLDATEAEDPVVVFLAGAAALRATCSALLRASSKVILARDTEEAQVVLFAVQATHDVQDMALLNASIEARPILAVSDGSRAALEAACLREGALGLLWLPLEGQELEAWLGWAVLRWAKRTNVQASGMVVDIHLREAAWNGRPLVLSPREFDVLAYLYRYQGRVVPRRQIVQYVWEGQLPSESRTLDVRIAHIRRSLAAVTERDVGPYIETIEKIGYRLHVP